MPNLTRYPVKNRLPQCHCDRTRLCHFKRREKSAKSLSFRPKGKNLTECHFDRREKSYLELKKARFLTCVRNDKVGMRPERSGGIASRG
jgi:hypothetical protein